MTRRTLEARLIYAIIVAGKNSGFARRKTRQLLKLCLPGESPLNLVDRLCKAERLEPTLREIRTGNYTKLTKALAQLAELKIDLRTCRPEDLEQVHGIGPKTSRFFILWTRKDSHCAALDVHVLRWLKSCGHDVPKQTPSHGKEYARCERLFLSEAAARGMAPRELDAQVWESGAKRAWATQL